MLGPQPNHALKQLGDAKKVVTPAQKQQEAEANALEETQEVAAVKGNQETAAASESSSDSDKAGDGSEMEVQEWE